MYLVGPFVFAAIVVLVGIVVVLRAHTRNADYRAKAQVVTAIHSRVAREDAEPFNTFLSTCSDCRAYGSSYCASGRCVYCR